MTFPSSADFAKNVSVFYCPSNAKFVWILSDTTPFYVASITSSIAFPATICINILVIITVWKTSELQTNSNILLASMAIADLLVGAVSMPLTITLDILLLRNESSLTICEIAFANQLVIYGAVCSSLYHLTVVAWERYVAVEKSFQYNVIVRRARVKKFAINAWILAVLTTAPVRILVATGVQYSYIEVLDVIFSLPAVVCMVLIGYFYAKVCLGVRKLKRTRDIGCSTRVRVRHENGITKRTVVITVVTFVYFIPSVVVLLFGKAAPFLRTSSFFRWSELIIQLNSLMNPILYCFALNHHFRDVVLKMMKIRKPNTDHMAERLQAASFKRRLSRQTGATKILNLKEFKEEQLLPDLIARTGPQESNSSAFAGAVYQSHAIFNSQPMTRKAIPAPSCKANGNICVDVHQPKRERRRIKPTGRRTKKRVDQSLPNSNSKQAMELRPIRPSTSCQVNTTTYANNQQSNLKPHVRCGSTLKRGTGESSNQSISNHNQQSVIDRPDTSCEENRAFCVDVNTRKPREVGVTLYDAAKNQSETLL